MTSTDELLIDQDGILEATRQRMAEAGITEKAEKQLLLYMAIYLSATFLGILLVGLLIFWLVNISFWLVSIGCIVIFLALCALYGIWVFFVGGRFDVETNNIVFVKVFQQHYKAVGAGRHHLIPHLQSLGPLSVGLKPTKVKGITSIDLKGTKTAKNLPGNPRNRVIINYTLIYRVVKPYIVVMEAPGDIASEKEELLKSRFQDRFQSYINDETMDEDEIISLAGQKLDSTIPVFNNIFNEWGIEFISIEIGETEIDKDTQTERKKAYQAQQERENRTRILDGIAHDLFDKSLSELSIPERREINDQWNTQRNQDAFAQPGTRIITGGTKALEDQLTSRAAIASRNEDRENDN